MSRRSPLARYAKSKGGRFFYSGTQRFLKKDLTAMLIQSVVYQIASLVKHIESSGGGPGLSGTISGVLPPCSTNKDREKLLLWFRVSFRSFLVPKRKFLSDQKNIIFRIIENLIFDVDYDVLL